MSILRYETGASWTQNGQQYTEKGQGPVLTILVKMAAGNLVITH
jgi:hypothetical protein